MPVSIIKLLDTANRTDVLLTGGGDDLANTTIIKTSRLTGASTLVSSWLVGVRKINYNVPEGYVSLYWHGASANVPIVNLSGSGVIEFKPDNMILNNDAVSPSGDIGMFSVGQSTNSTFSITISLKKDARHFDVTSPTYDVDAQLYFDAVYAAGSTISNERKSLISEFISSLKTDGNWYALDDMWLLVTEDLTQALVSLKQRRLGVAVNAPSFVSDGGITFDGTTNYIDTGWQALYHARVMKLNSCRIGVYCLANVSSTGYAIGSSGVSTQLFRIQTRNASGTTSIQPIGNGIQFVLPTLDSRGLTSGSRTGTALTDYVGYKNGAALVRSVDAISVGSALPMYSLFLGGVNSTGTFSTGIPGMNIGCAFVGAFVTAEQELSFYNTIQRLMTSLGVAV